MNEYKTCIIFGAGEHDGVYPQINCSDFVIAADGGYKRLRELGSRVDLLVGDLDSLGFAPDGVDTLRLAPEKDDTDMAIAIAEGTARGCGRFLIYGGLGGRLDHTFGNIQLAAGLARRGAECFLISSGCTVTAVHNGGAVFSEKYSGYLSVFAFGGQAAGVCERGLKYLLDDFTLEDDVTRGVSNEFTGAEAEVSVLDGTLLLMWQGNANRQLPQIYHF